MQERVEKAARQRAREGAEVEAAAAEARDVAARTGHPAGRLLVVSVGCGESLHARSSGALAPARDHREGGGCAVCALRAAGVAQLVAHHNADAVMLHHVLWAPRSRASTSERARGPPLSAADVANEAVDGPTVTSASHAFE